MIDIRKHDRLAASAVTELPAAGARYNDWRGVSVPPADALRPAMPISVVVPYHEAPHALALTLAGLEGQTWPRELVEVVVVDDGSRPPLPRAPETTLRLRVVRQADRGFGLARARNKGAAAAAHDILVFLDCDVIPESGLLAAHARWHQTVSDALTLGFCASVSTGAIDAAAVRDRRCALRDLFAAEASDPPWLERHMARTDDLTVWRDDLFRAVTGNNLGIRRSFFREVGGFDESFTRYGGEDTEFGYRVQVRGGLLVPVRDGFGWHQGRWDTGRDVKERAAGVQGGKLANLIPQPGFRHAAPGRTFAVPRHVVTIEGDAAVEVVLEAAEAVLADPTGDVTVRIVPSAGSTADEIEWLENHLGPDPRVRIAPGTPALDEFPAAPVHMTLPASAWRPGLSNDLVRALGQRAAVTAAFEDGSSATVAQAWALHRARRAGGAASDFGDFATVRMAAVARRRPVATPRWGVGGELGRVIEEARHVRGLKTAARFLKWLYSGTRSRLSRHRSVAAQALAPCGAVLGVEVAALGPRSRAVFAASARVAHRLEGRHVDVALADTANERTEARAAGVPVVTLDDAAAPLVIPALDTARHNPIGWPRDVESRVAALGPLECLPPGCSADRVIPPGDGHALRHIHHVEDVAAFHRGAVERAGTLVRLAGAGVPVRLVDRCPDLEALLGPELHALMTADVEGADAAAREFLSVGLRRVALRDHALSARARQLCTAAALPDAPQSPLVSVLLATRRPKLLVAAIASVARQTYSRLELVVALHGPGFEDVAAERLAGRAGCPVRVLRFDASTPLGTILNHASAAATGSLLAKMDDDDAYGAEHLQDLVLAQEYSGAELVGKYPATVYLCRVNRTVRCRRTRSESFSASVTGGAMLVARHGLERAGGWRRAPRHVDRSLIDDVLRAGGSVYRTHDLGYLLVRHGERHTWDVDDDWFLAQAEEVRPGWQPALAGIDGALAPPFVVDGAK